MVCKLLNEDRNILEYRPNVVFTEPNQEDGVIEGTDELQFEDIQEARSKIKKLAQAVNTLATGVQARVDQRAGDMFITLDRNVDADTIDAMLRRFPDDDPYKITYKQYRQCRNAIRDKGEEVGKQALITSKQVEDARNRLSAGGQYIPGGFDRPGVNNGDLRPEINPNAYIIPPLNVQEIQIDLICILVNYTWKNYIKKFLSGVPIVGGAIFALPDKLCDPGFDGLPGLLLLGGEPDDLLSGRKASEELSEVANDAAQVGIEGL